MTVRNLLVTGPPGCGKTTLVDNCRCQLADLSPRGFLTREIRQGCVRLGFALNSIPAGRVAILAHIDISGAHRIGKYGVDVPGFERYLIGLEWPDDPRCPVIIDEIGKMECLSPLFRRTVERWLDAPNPLIATIALRGTPFIQRIRNRPDVVLRTISPENRSELGQDILASVRMMTE
jgi:nucleoside-triphosphatase